MDRIDNISINDTFTMSDNEKLYRIVVTAVVKDVSVFYEIYTWDFKVSAKPQVGKTQRSPYKDFISRLNGVAKHVTKGSYESSATERTLSLDLLTDKVRQALPTGVTRGSRFQGIRALPFADDRHE